MSLNRRHFLQAAGALAFSPIAVPARAAATGTVLTAERRIIDVLGKAAPVFGLRSSQGGYGFRGHVSQPFDVVLDNRLGEETLIHWHGQTPPAPLDGMPILSQPLLKPGAKQAYSFKARPGTHWMHSHHALQEQRLLTAPLIVTEDDTTDIQDIVVMLHDFSFRSPEDILTGLTGTSGGSHGMQHGGDSRPRSGMTIGAMMSHLSGMFGGQGHLHDVDYDAYIANDRTLEDPEVIRVETGGRVRLRFINGAASTAFIIDLGQLEGTVVAVDGNPVQPIRDRLFPLAMAQRIDIVVSLPRSADAWPILAYREGRRERTGIVLAPYGAAISRISSLGEDEAGVIGLSLEGKLRTLEPLPSKPIQRRIDVLLNGGRSYAWGINNGEPVLVKRGERVEMTIRNRTMMMHPIHLHGHHFQVVKLNGQPVQGAVRDTIAVPAHGGEVTVLLDADNPGEWMFHCHNLYHMAAGMMTTLKYE
jgi:FtsP/CotA-like multicopper oxidase with cupredoxin domain